MKFSKNSKNLKKKLQEKYSNLKVVEVSLFYFILFFDIYM